MERITPKADNFSAILSKSFDIFCLSLGKHGVEEVIVASSKRFASASMCHCAQYSLYGEDNGEKDLEHFDEVVAIV